MTDEDFFEEDEPVEKVVEAFKRGEKRTTKPPDNMEDALRRISEIAMRTVADQHRDEIIDPDSAVPITPKKFDVVKSVRMDIDTVEALRARAAHDGLTESDLLRTAVQRLAPVGFSCQHMSLTAGPMIQFTSVQAGCGCTMQPVYA